ncbi:UDP-N-acetylmuramate--alanine ligase [Cochleicola gelatinilyticus]|uniref:UDP-N-acetylmuramate--alanine ligase n=2 Tax=Cochleicola gelatinilyticus TaxID=1763537 RepID=A0A167F619_9FLAO|nr:UDP-N-acetylmuramate--alanine ligase [Cochleicola gelatinilyticus]
MSALARYFNGMGKQVYGYDKTPSDLTTALISEGITITFKDSVSEIPAIFKDKSEVLIVHTPAIPKQNSILNHFRNEGYFLLKRAGLLGEVTKNTLCLAVAGTHGKTTTSAILGHLLAACDMPVTAFLGGIAENYQSNYIGNGTEITVVEADEFDRSFLTLSPDIACVTSMDADHLDIYGEASEIEAAFTDFVALLPKKENLLFRKGLPLVGRSVAIEESADFEAQNVRIKNGGYLFDLKTPNLRIKDLQFYLPGQHNLHNAVTALGMAILAGSPTDCLPKALSEFKGVQRRFSYKIKRDDLVLIDDYAHHPTELNALLQAVNEMYPEDRKLIVFQPHLYSRTRDFVDGFAESLSKFDEVVLLDIYPAREEAIEGVTSEWLLEKINDLRTEIQSKATIKNKTELTEAVSVSKSRVRLLVGAGDIGAEVQKITNALQ